MIKKKSRTDQSEEARLERVAALRSRTGKKLSAFSLSYLNAENLVGNIENFIGSTSLPLGLAGPLQIHFKKGTEDISAAFATSEGALVSSISRGVLALNISRGVQVRYLENTVTRAPVFIFSELDQAIHFAHWIPKELEELKRKTKESSKRAQLLDIQVKILITEVHVLFIYSTGEAAGQNMTTLITSSLAQWIRQKYAVESGSWIEHIGIEGNLASDKKVSTSLFAVGRGRKVIAQALIPSAVSKKVLKVSNHQLCKNFNRMKSARIFSGYQGFNINVANVVAGLFLATGQDAASIHESSVAELHMEMQGEDLFVSLYMPSLVVGTVGGGTHLPHAKNCLDLMGCEGPESANKLAEIICAYALALEISTVSAIESGHFAQAHSSLGRDQQKNFKPEDLGAEFLNQILIDEKSMIQSTEPLEFAEFDDAMMVDLATISARRISGLFRLKSQWNNSQNFTNLILKIKNSDSDVIATSQFMLQNLGLHSVCENDLFAEYHPFTNTQLNEIEKNKLLNQKKLNFIPQIYASTLKENVGFILQQEILGAKKKFKKWTRAEVDTALSHLVVIHNLSMPQELEPLNYQKSKTLWFELIESLLKKEIIRDEELKKIFNSCLRKYDTIFSDFPNLEKRFCHLDYNPRNLLFSEDQIFVIDWEFSGHHLPQRDLIEFLIFNLNSLTEPEVKKILSLHSSQIQMTKQSWEKGLLPAFSDFLIRRLSLYLVISEFKEIHFLEQVLKNTCLFWNNILVPDYEPR